MQWKHNIVVKKVKKKVEAHRKASRKLQEKLRYILKEDLHAVFLPKLTKNLNSLSLHTLIHVLSRVWSANICFGTSVAQSWQCLIKVNDLYENRYEFCGQMVPKIHMKPNDRHSLFQALSLYWFPKLEK